MKVLFLFLSSLLLTSMSTNAILLGNKTDKLSLLAFKSRITSDPLAILSSWNDTVNFCNWSGVSCRSQRHPQRVTAIDLTAKGLVGYISPSIANLTFLANFSLAYNGFYGEIPSEVGNLPRLQLLDLSFNSLHGAIPVSLSNCSRLAMLNFDSNTLSGRVPVELGNSLANLGLLELSNNSFSGAIPVSIGNLSSLYHLGLIINQLEGTMPEELGRLQNLQYFQVSGNKLSGMVPSSLFNLSSLYDFGVASNELEGSLPSTLGTTLPNLQSIRVGGNRFEGRIPASLANASGLSFVDMSYNSLNGNLPSDLGRLGALSQLNFEDNQLETSDAKSWEFLASLSNCSQLKMLSLFHNNLSGELPDSIGNLSTQLQELRLNGNQIYGSIPSAIENLVNLSILALGPNLITGVIPEGIGKLKRLQFLDFFVNRLVGRIPSSLGNLTELVYLYLTGNNLEGPLPLIFGSLQRLEELGLGDNRFDGTIPREIFSISSLTSLGLSFNSLVGPLPSELGSLTFLQKLHLSSNELSGKIPPTIGSCQLLELLDLSHNFLQGFVPLSLSNVKSLQFLDLSQNNLSGPIPDFLEKLSLGYLNLSFNQFEGEVPMEGVFRNATVTSVFGNDGLCGGISEFHLPSCPSRSSEGRGRGKGKSLLLKVMIPVGIIVFLLCVLVFTVVFYKKLKSRKDTPSLPSLNDQYSRVSYVELAKATDGFSSANLIGSGGYGSVYKGTLDHGNTIVAIKVFNLEPQRASKSFIAECEALRSTRHRNLVKILTSCSSVDSQGNDFKALVFEFMPNGSLETWLHSNKNIGHDESKALSLSQRLNIAIDVADALHYLHHECETPVVHCDLKPSNILLDDDMVAHVSDFGLARLLPEVMSKSLQDSTSWFGMKGSIGYIAPEYGAGESANTSGDVYSFGILLLEMFTGRRPVDDIFVDGLNLYKFVEIAFPNQVMEIIDPLLLLQGKEAGNFEDSGKYGSNSARRMQECLISVMRVGLSCSKGSPKERMDMRNVATELNAIREALFKEPEIDQLEGKAPQQI